MKKLVLACTVLLVVAAITAPTAQAFPICFKWIAFCDGIQVNALGVGGAEWYHWDCANNSPMDAADVFASDNCSGAVERGFLRSGNPPGDYYFQAIVPLDGTLDMLQGVWPFGVCWIPGLQYNLQMGACTGIQGQGHSTVQ